MKINLQHSMFDFHLISDIAVGLDTISMIELFMLVRYGTPSKDKEMLVLAHSVLKENE